jgi:hypothetical protein
MCALNPAQDSIIPFSYLPQLLGLIFPDDMNRSSIQYRWQIRMREQLENLQNGVPVFQDVLSSLSSDIIYLFVRL